MAGGYEMNDEEMARMLQEADGAEQDEVESLAESEDEDVVETEEEDEQQSGDEPVPIIAKDDKHDDEGDMGVALPSPGPSSSTAPTTSKANPKKSKKPVPSVSAEFLKELEGLNDEMLALKITEMEDAEALVHEQAKVGRKVMRDRQTASKAAGKPTSKEKAKAKSKALEKEKKKDILINFRFNGETFVVKTQSGRGIGHMRTLFMMEAKVDTKHRHSLKFIFKDKDLFDARDARTTMRSMGISDGITIDVSVRGLGCGVIKPFLKDSDAINKLHERSQNTINKKMSKEDTETFAVPEANLPSNIKDYITEKRGSLNTIKLMKEQSGMSIIKFCLTNVNTEDLESIKKIIQQREKGHKGGTEEKVLRASYLIFPAIREIKSVISNLTSFEQEVSKELLRLYVSEYHKVENGEAKIDNTAFIDHIDKELGRREQNNPTHANLIQQVEQSNCTIF